MNMFFSSWKLRKRQLILVSTSGVQRGVFSILGGGGG